MQKVKTNIILSIILSILGLTSFLVLPLTKKSVNADTLPEGYVVAGTVSRNATKLELEQNDGWRYDYEESSGEFISDSDASKVTDLSNQIVNTTNPPYVMLSNFNADQNLLKSTPETSEVENLYIGVGKRMSGTVTEYFDITNVQAFLQNDYVFKKYSKNKNYNNENEYGIYIQTNNIIKGEVTINGTAVYNEYWYQYFDLNQVYAITGESSSELIDETEGLYTVLIEGYFYKDNGNGSLSQQQVTLTYQFYLLNNSSYYEAPDFNRTIFNYNKNNSGAGTYYNSYQTLDVPTFVYNATKFNVNYTHELNSVKTNTTTDFKLAYDENENESGVLTINNGSSQQTVVMVLDEDNNLVKYYNGSISEENEIGHLQLKYQNNRTEYLLTLKNDSDYEERLVKVGPVDTQTLYVNDGKLYLDETYQTEFTTANYVIEDGMVYTTSYEIKNCSVVSISPDRYAYYNENLYELPALAGLDFSKPINPSMYNITTDEDGVQTLTINGESNTFTKLKFIDVAGKIYHINSSDNTVNNGLFSDPNLKVLENYVVSLNDEYVITDNKITITKSAAPIDYYYCILADELGEYTFNSNCIISKDGTDFDIMNYVGTDLLKNITYTDYETSYQGNEVLQFATLVNGVLTLPDGFTELTETTTLEDGTKTPTEGYDKSTDGSYDLFNYGTKAYFYKNGEKTLFENLNSTQSVRSNITYKVNSELTKENISDLTKENISELTKENISDLLPNIINNAALIPSTNLQSIYLDFYGLYDYNEKGYTSEYYYYSKNEYKIEENGHLNLLKAPSKSTFRPSDDLYEDGLYLVKSKIRYSSISSTKPEVATQYYAFIIDNTAPKLTLQYQDEEDGNYENLDTSTKYTNKSIISATWADPTYFQGDIKVKVERRAVNADEHNDVLETIEFYVKNGGISLDNKTTQDGRYTVTIYYGNNYASFRSFVFIKDTALPTGNVYTETKDGNNTIISKVENLNIFNTLFTFAGSTSKDSGAKINAYYLQVPFNVVSNFTAEKVDDLSGVTTNYEFDANNTLLNEDNFEKFEFDELPENLTKLDELAENKKLGKDGSMVYIFKLIDEAQNVNYYYYIFDQSTPQNVFLGEDDNVLTDEDLAKFQANNYTSDKKTSAYWGENKLIQVSNISKNNTLFTQLTKFIEENPSRFLNLTKKQANDKSYWQLSLSEATINSKIDGTDVTVTSPNTKLAESFTGYFESHNNQGLIPTNLGDYWKLSGDTAFGVKDFFIGVRKLYRFKITDVLKNSKSGSLQINIDKAQLSFEVYDTEVEFDNVYNGKKLVAIFNNTVSGDVETNIDNSEPNSSEEQVDATYKVKVTYDYYPFSTSTYITDTTDTKVEKITNVFNTKPYKIPSNNFVYDPNTGYGEGSFNDFYPTYPFSATAQYSNIEVNGTINEDTNITSAEINVVGDSSMAGLYVFRRVFIDENGNELDQASVYSKLSENDFAELYTYIIIDRNNLFNIVFNENGSVSNISSIGDYIKFILANGTTDQTEITSEMIYLLMQSTNLTLFDTNRVSVGLSVPTDKYATSEKLNSDLTTFDINAEITLNPGTENEQKVPTSNFVNNSINTNKNLFKQYIVLTTSSYEKLYDSREDGNEDLDLSKLNQDKTYTLTIYDNSYIKPITGDIDWETAHSQTFTFTINHDVPKGEYTTAINLNSEIPLTIRNGAQLNEVIYNSINEEALKFKFEETLDIYKAKIDAKNITVKQNSSVIFQKTNGVVTTIPAGVTENDVLQKTLLECKCTCEDCSNKNHEKCLNENDHAYSYVLTIFDKFNDISLVSDYTADAFYYVTLQYKGDETDYTTGDGQSFFKCTYQIHVDTTAPAQNLEKLKREDRHYNNQDLNEYFLPVSISESNPTVFDGSDSDESTALFIRKIDDLTTFVPSLLPNEEGYTDINVKDPRFSEDSQVYTKITYDDHNERKANSIELLENNRYKKINNGYYEVIERDEAGNYTKYNIYAYSGNGEDITFNYYKNQVDATDEILSSVNLSSDNSLKDNNIALDYLNAYELDSINYDYDAFVNVQIIALEETSEGLTDGAVLSSLVCEGTKETTEDFFKRVVEEFKNITENDKIHYQYKLVISNRFNTKDYEIQINVPSKELELAFESTINGTLKVTVPQRVNTVWLTKFSVQKFNSGWNEVNNDLYSTIIKQLDENSPVTTYEFSAGQYRFITTDNFGRKNTEYYYVGSNNVQEYSFSYTSAYITNETVLLNERVNLTTTSGNIKLSIDVGLWDINIENLTNVSWDEYENYTKNQVSNSSLNEFVLNAEGTYKVGIKWATDSTDVFTYYYFKIDKTVPEIELYSNSGNMDVVSNSTYTENFYIEWSSAYKTQTSIKHTVNGNTTITTFGFDDTTNTYFIEASGNYVITITDEIGNVNVFAFTKIEANYSYFDVKVDNKEVNYSNYTSISNNRTVYYYYVNYEKLVFGDDDNSVVEYNVPTVQLQTNATKGIESLLINNQGNPAESTIEKDENGQITNVGEYDEYKIYSKIKSGEEEYIICFVRIVYVQKTNDFAQITILNSGQPQASAINIKSSNVFESVSESVTLSFNQYNSYELNPSLYNGNLVYADYYFNGEYVKTLNVNNLTLSNRQSITLTVSGLHTFKFYDYSGNVQNFELNETTLTDKLNILLVNNVIYTVNNDMPINNAFFNTAVKLNLITTLLDKQIFAEEPSVKATLNGNAIELAPINNEYLFTQNGYYTVTISGKSNISDVETELNTTYNFTIVNPNVAKLSFSMSSSYGFTVTELLRNDGDITSTLTNRTSLWIAAGEYNADNAVYTITCSYYNEVYGQFQTFSFKVWINDSTPVIVPVNYTYGTSTTNPIVLQFDLNAIYNEIGEGYILVKGIDNDAEEKIAITSASIGGVQEYTVTESGTFSVGIYNEDGRLISSYKVIKKTPLNTSTIIIIVIVSVVIVGLTAVFIFIRKRAKFR